MNTSTVIQVKVIPNASQNKIEGWKDGILRVRIRAIPEKGKANAALIALLSDALKIPKTALKIVSGLSSRIKRVLVEGLTQEEIVSLLSF